MLASPKAAKVHNRGWPNEVREPTADRKQTMRPRRGRTSLVLATFLLFALFEDASSLFIVRRLTAFGCFASGYEPSPPSATAIPISYIRSSMARHPQKWIFMQKHETKCINIQCCVFTFLYTIFVNILIICKQMCFACLHFSELIPFICKTLGFTSWFPWFHLLKPLVSHPKTKAFRV